MNQNHVKAQTSGESLDANAYLLPAVDVTEDASGITLYADLPGVAKDQLKLHVEADLLTIEGELGLNAPAEIEASHIEVTQPRYRRAFTLSKELDVEHIDAKFEHGVLTLRLPKAQHAQPRRIEVQAG